MSKKNKKSAKECKIALHKLQSEETEQVPQETKMKRKEYENELYELQVELCKLQDWVVEKKLKVIIVFEGRDGAGKGGTIRALTEKGEFSCVSCGCTSCTNRERKNTNPASTLHEPLPCWWRSGHL